MDTSVVVPLLAQWHEAHALPAQLAELDVAGGAVYDALVAVTVREHGGELLTLDARAAQTYRKLAIPFTLVTS